MKKKLHFYTASNSLCGKKIDIPDRLGPSTGHLQLIGMPTLPVGPLSSEEFVPLVKGFTFIYIEKRRKSSIFTPLRTASVGKKIDIPDRLRPSTGYLQLIGMPTWHIGPLGSEEFDHKLKGFTFIVILDVHVNFIRQSCQTRPCQNWLILGRKRN